MRRAAIHFPCGHIVYKPLHDGAERIIGLKYGGSRPNKIVFYHLPSPELIKSAQMALHPLKNDGLRVHTDEEEYKLDDREDYNKLRTLVLLGVLDE